MNGITKFKSTEHALHCREIAKKRLKKIELLYIPSLITSIFLFITYFYEIGAKPTSFIFHILDFLLMIAFIGGLVMLCYSGSIIYIGKLITAPFRKFDIVIALIAFVWWIGVCALLPILFPFALMAYAKRLCKETLEATAELE